METCALKACSKVEFADLLSLCSWEMRDACISSTGNCERFCVSSMHTTIDSNIVGKLLKIFSTTLPSLKVSPYDLSWFTSPIIWVESESILSDSFMYMVSKSLLSICSLVVFTLPIPWYVVWRIFHACFDCCSFITFTKKEWKIDSHLLDYFSAYCLLLLQQCNFSSFHYDLFTSLCSKTTLFYSCSSTKRKIGNINYN